MGEDQGQVPTLGPKFSICTQNRVESCWGFRVPKPTNGNVNVAQISYEILYIVFIDKNSKTYISFQHRPKEKKKDEGQNQLKEN